MNYLAEITENVQKFTDLNPGAVIMFVAFGAFFGYLMRSIPLIRWIAAACWIFMAVNSPILIAWQLPHFWMAWGFAIMFVLRWKDKILAATSLDLALPSSPYAGYRIKAFSRGIGIAIWWCIKKFWKLLRNLTFFICVSLPVASIRLSFWLCRTLPKLRTAAGWWLLIKGIWLWFWNLLPFPIRSEWNRLWQGKSVKESFQEDMNRYWQKEREKQKRREERELRNSFRRLKKLVKKLAQKGISPEEFARQCEEEERNEQQQSTYQDSSRTQSNTSSSTNDFREEHRRRTQQEKQRERSSSSRSSQSSRSSDSSQQTYSNSQKQEEPKPKPKPKPQPKKISPLTKEFYDKHRDAFLEAKWEYDPSEERYQDFPNAKTHLEACQIVGVPPETDKKDGMKSFKKLYARYAKYNLPIHPKPVQLRGEEICKVLNSAREIFRGRV